MPIKEGDTVTVDYEGRFENGDIFDSSKHGDHSHPLTFTVGQGQVIRGFEKAVIGMSLNEKKEVTIKPKDAYGDYTNKLKRQIPREALNMDHEPKPGMILKLSTPEGREASAPIVAVDNKSVTLDLNHPLAGKTLIFDIKVIDTKSSK